MSGHTFMGTLTGMTLGVLIGAGCMILNASAQARAAAQPAWAMCEVTDWSQVQAKLDAGWEPYAAAGTYSTTHYLFRKRLR
jgi:hypothetical protein